MDTTRTAQQLPSGVTLHGPWQDRHEEIFTTEALAFVAGLHRRFEVRRQELLENRRVRQKQWDRGDLPGFLPETRHIRDDPEWRIAPLPEGLLDRRVEITGPVDRKMMINAFNSGARMFMADFEDSHSPTWRNNVDGQLNLLDYSHDRLVHEDRERGRTYKVAKDPATLVVRVRGIHLPEVHMRVDGEPVAGALFDFGLHFWHNAWPLLEKGSGPWYYLPKLEHYEEAGFWNEVFNHAEEKLRLEPGTIKVTCLIETFPAVFQMEEIIHALRSHIAGLNAGRWDYIFSCIKIARNHGDKVLPDRSQVTMGVPFMRAYSRLLVKTCHKRGAFAMGGMSAFIPGRDPQITEKAFVEVRADKKREAEDGFDGTWVAHPGLVSVATEVFDEALGGRANQLEVERDDVVVTKDQLQDFHVPDGRVTLAGLRSNLEVALVYLESWLGGKGAVAIHDLMEDAATAEISRSQVWQWVHHNVPLDNGTRVTKALVSSLLENLVATQEARREGSNRLQTAGALLRRVSLSDEFPEFLTLPAYETLIKETLE